MSTTTPPAPLTDDEIAAAEAACAAAPMPPWHVSEEFHGGVPMFVVCEDTPTATSENDPTGIVTAVSRHGRTEDEDRALAHFIAIARSALPRALAEVRRLREEVARLRQGGTDE